MTQYEIAKRLGISDQAVSKWFKGKNLPSTQNLMALSKLLGKTLEETIIHLKKAKATRK